MDKVQKNSFMCYSLIMLSPKSEYSPEDLRVYTKMNYSHVFYISDRKVYIW
jgi:hypothetical protein